MSTETPQSSQPAADQESPIRTSEDIAEDAKTAAEAVLAEIDAEKLSSDATTAEKPTAEPRSADEPDTTPLSPSPHEETSLDPAQPGDDKRPAEDGLLDQLARSTAGDSPQPFDEAANAAESEIDEDADAGNDSVESSSIGEPKSADESQAVATQEDFTNATESPEPPVEIESGTGEANSPGSGEPFSEEASDDKSTPAVAGHETVFDQSDGNPAPAGAVQVGDESSDSLEDAVADAASPEAVTDEAAVDRLAAEADTSIDHEVAVHSEDPAPHDGDPLNADAAENDVKSTDEDHSSPQPDLAESEPSDTESKLHDSEPELDENASPEQAVVDEVASEPTHNDLDDSSTTTEETDEPSSENPAADFQEEQLADSSQVGADEPGEDDPSLKDDVSEPSGEWDEDEEIVPVEFSADELDFDDTPLAGFSANQSEDVSQPIPATPKTDVGIQTAAEGRLMQVWRLIRARPVVAGLTAVVTLSTVGGIGKLLHDVRDADRRISLANQERDQAVAAGKSATDAAVKMRTELDRERTSRQQAEQERQAALSELEQLQSQLANVGDAGQRGNGQSPGGADRAEQLALLEQERAARENAEHQARLASRRLRTSRLQTYNSQLDLVREVWQNNPVKALMLLEDEERCPAEFRDFTWRYFYRLSKRDRLTIDAHEAGVSAVCYSPDGTMIASAGVDGDVALWSAASGSQITRFPERMDGVTSLAFSPNGSLLAAAGRDGALLLWDMQSGQLRDSRSDPEGGILTLDFSPDGKILASAGLSWSIRLWDVRGLRVRSTLVGHTANVRSVDFSPNGDLLASASQDGTIKLWNTKTRELTATRWGHRRTRNSAVESGTVPGVWAVAFSPDGETLASGGTDSIRFWNSTSMQLRAETSEPTGIVSAIVFSHDGSTLASATDRQVRIWDSHSGRPQGGFKGHPTITSLSFAPHDAVLATAGDDGTIKLWNTRSTGDPAVATFGGQSEDVTAVAVSPLGDVLASSDGRTIRLRTLKAVPSRSHTMPEETDLDGRLALLEGHSSRITALAFSTDGATLASASADWPILLWDVASRRVRLALNGHTGGITSMAFSADGQLFASGSEDKTVRLWDASTGRPLATLEGHPDSVLGVAFSPDGKTLASVGNDELIRLWSTENATMNSTLRITGAAASQVAFSPDGRLLTAVVLSGQAPRSGNSGGSTSPAGKIELWDVESAVLRATAGGNGRPSRSLQFSPDGQSLATSDGTQVCLWDPQTGHERAKLVGAAGEIASIAFTPDGHSLIAGGARGITLWSTAASAADPHPVIAPRP